ncbi:MAG: hypothetical protein DIU56_012645 [Pseudomonadota bacterium]|nr:MAG: hypothetical protein DIU56_08400 [Pseudomonadota bacterium]
MMKKAELCAALAAGLLLSHVARAECVLPPAPSKIPDGATATEQEMIAAMQTLKRYDGDVNVYLKCLEFEAKQNRLSKAEQDRRHNEAVAKLEKIAAQFNEQVRIFKSKSG